MSNDNQFERLWKLQAKVNMMVLDGKRDPKSIANIYQAILEGSVTASFNVSQVELQFEVWKRVKIGVHKNHDAVTTMLTEFKVSDRAKEILGKPALTLAQVEEEVDLAVATVKQLTGKNEATTKEIFDAIKRVGDLVPSEVGTALREQYLDQPNGEFLYIAMESIQDFEEVHRVFAVVCCDSELWLRAVVPTPTVFSGDGVGRFVFCPRKVSSVA